MTKQKLQKLLKTRFAMVVKEAMKNGELDLFNINSWTRTYNSGMEDINLEREVRALVEYFNK